MDKCPKCGGDVKHIPAGVSKKTGKPYDEFWACQSCDYKTKFQPKPAGSQEGGASVGGGKEELLPALREIYNVLKEIRDGLKRKDEWQDIRGEEIDTSEI